MLPFLENSTVQFANVTELTRPTWMEIDLSGLESNYHEIRKRIGKDTKIISSIKADAYGHGVVPVAKKLVKLGTDILATGSFNDALCLRNAGIKAKILMFGGNLPQAASDLLRNDLIPTIYNIESAKAISKVALSPTQVFIKVDSGFGRLGIPIEEANNFIHSVSQLPSIVIEGIYTHLPFFDKNGRDWARKHLLEFDKLVQKLAEENLYIPISQSRNSACLACGLKDNCTAVSPGHLLYGLSPTNSGLADLTDFKPVLSAIKTKLIHIHRHPFDRTIEVGSPYRIEGGTVTGVVPIGLYDGYRKPIKETSPFMLMRGKRIPVIGVSLEFTTLDLSSVDKPLLGEEIVVLGKDRNEQISIDNIAEWQGGKPLGVLMSFEGRLPIRNHVI